MSNQEDSDALDDAIETVVDRVLNNSVSVSFPAQITKVKRSKVNPNTVVVDVAPNLMDLDPQTGTPIPDEILNVPIQFVGRTNNFLIRPPTDDDSLVGAGVNCIVCDRYLANWKKTGGLVVASDARRFDIADAVAILGLYPDVNSWPFPPKTKTAQMKVLNGTFIEIGNSTTDIPRLLADFMDIFTNAVAPSGGGSLVLLPSTISGKTLTQLVTEFASLYNPDPAP